MHELSLYGSVTTDHHHRLLQILAGVTSMQPIEVEEIHLVFKTRQPAGVNRVLAPASQGGTGATQQQEFQKLKTMLQSGIFFVKLIGTIQKRDGANQMNSSSEARDGLVQDWTLEFKDTPEAAKQPVTNRVSSRVSLSGDHIMDYMNFFGFEYTSRYLTKGHRYYTQDTTLYLYRIHPLPTVGAAEATALIKLSDVEKLELLDGSGAYVMQTTVEIADGQNQELRTRATTQLTSLRDMLRPVVKLEPAERLALDTRIPLIRKAPTQS